MEKKSRNQTLISSLSPVNVWAIAFGCIIGWGSFVNPGKKFLPNSGVAGTAIAMALGALVMIIIAFSYAYLVPKHPEAGGEFTFTKAYFGKRRAFLCGWFLLAAYLTNVPMNSTAIGLIVDGLDGGADILKFGFHYSIAGFEVYLGEILLSMAILLLFAMLNMQGVKRAGVVQTVLSGLLIGSVLLLSVSVFLSSKARLGNLEPIWGFDKAAAMAAGATAENIEEFAHGGPMGKLSAVLVTFAIAPWAFVGFDTIPQAAEEFKFSYQKVIGIMVIAILFGCFVYVSNNTVAAIALENWPEKVMAGDWVLLVAVEELLGVPGKILVGVAVSCAVLSGIMGFYLASSRLLFSMARDGYLPEVFGLVDQKSGTPRNAMLFCLFVSLSGPILGREALGWFVDMSAIGASMGYLFTCASTLKSIRRDRDASGGLIAMAAIGAVFSVAFMVLQLIPIPGLIGVHFCTESYIMLAAWLLIGAVFYCVQVKNLQNKETETRNS